MSFSHAGGATNARVLPRILLLDLRGHFEEGKRREKGRKRGVKT